MNSAQETSWRRVWIAFVAGCVIAFHIGKIPAAIPSLIDQLQIDLFWAGLVISAFAFITGTTGLFMGRFTDRIGHHHAAVAGLLSCTLGSLVGAFATDIAVLLASRILEGLGFILGVSSLPALIAQSTSDYDRPVALGIWGAFLPLGMSLMLLVSPWIIARIEWQGLWVVCSLLCLLWAAVFFAEFRGHRTAGQRSGPLLESLRLVWRPAPLLLFGCFVAYSAQFLSVTSFLPTLFIDEFGFTIGGAATLSALVIGSNTFGNLASGWLLRHGVSRRTLLAIGAGGMGVASILVFSPLAPLPLRALGAFCFTSISGLIPGVITASAPMVIERPSQLGSIMGFMIQGAGVGQIIGPPLLTGTVGTLGGWSYAPVFTLAATGFGIACSLGLQPIRSMRGQTTD